jgi:tetratricopeptide (TPR) repeat protein
LKISNVPMTLANRRASIRLYETIVEKYPDSPTAWYAKGLALTRLRIYDEAMDCFRTSIKNDPKAAGGFETHNMNVSNNK